MRISLLNRVLIVIGVSCLSFNTACRNRGGGDGGGNGGGSLTADQQAAVDAVVNQLDASAKALGTVAKSFTGLDASGDVTAGQCPVVTAHLASGILTVTSDFGDTGCTSDYYSGTASGSATLTLDTVSRSLDVVFNNLTVEGKTTTGSAHWQLTRTGSSRTLTGNVDIATTGVGSASGDLDVQINISTLVIDITQANLEISDTSNNTYTVALDGLRIDPLTNLNFVPESGSASFEILNPSPPPSMSSVVITFTANSPNTGVVEVSIDNAPAVQVTLPGF